MLDSTTPYNQQLRRLRLFTVSSVDHNNISMASLKRSLESDPFAANISSKVYVRSTKSGKVQKIVREVYLRQDIPCSSQICHACLDTAPRNAAGERKTPWVFASV
jgi:exosome complex exonuclease DIS3/RRP44